MRAVLIVPVLLLVLRGTAAAQAGLLPAPAPPPLATAEPSSAAASGVRLALVQAPDAPVLLEAVAHAGDRLAGTMRLRNATDRAVSGVIVAVTIGAGPDSGAPAFRRVRLVPIALGARETQIVEVPGVAVPFVRGLVGTDAPVVEVAIVGVRFASGPSWQSAGPGTWLGRPELAAPLACVDEAGQTDGVDARTTAAGAACQGGGQ